MPECMITITTTNGKVTSHVYNFDSADLAEGGGSRCPYRPIAGCNVGETAPSLIEESNGGLQGVTYHLRGPVREPCRPRQPVDGTVGLPGARQGMTFESPLRPLDAPQSPARLYQARIRSGGS